MYRETLRGAPQEQEQTMVNREEFSSREQVDENKEKREEMALDVESPELDEETRREATEEGIALMREVLRGIPDYAVFASTAMYLHGKKHDIPELQVLPGDFDGVVGSESTLKKVRERLANVPGVEFDRDGQFKVFSGDGTRVLSGRIIMEVEGRQGKERVGYPFEFFSSENRSRIVSKEIFDKRTVVDGLNVLNFEGLQNQYLNNLSFESQIHKSAEQVASFLMNPTVEEKMQDELLSWKENEAAFKPSPLLEKIQDEYQLSLDELQAFYEQLHDMKERQQDEEHETFDITPQMAKLLSGLKTKIPKRLKNVLELQAARRIGA